jgi:hypothetical protein
MTERRKETRKRCFLGARLEFNRQCSTMDCLIRDQSSAGARLVLTDSVTVPMEFDLVSIERSKKRRAEIAWRRGDQMGVRIVAAA